MLANLDAFYLEAQAAAAQLDSLHHSLDLAAESLRLTLLRYQAGEVTVLEVVDAQTTLAQARNAYDDGLVRYRVASRRPANSDGSLLMMNNLRPRRALLLLLLAACAKKEEKEPNPSPRSKLSPPAPIPSAASSKPTASSTRATRPPSFPKSALR